MGLSKTKRQLKEQKEEEDYEWQDIVKTEDGSLRTETRIISNELEEPSWNDEEDCKRVQNVTNAIHNYLGENSKMAISFLLPHSVKQKQQ
ncbi:hypothetical protein A0J61_03304 [Choanephora cucurbitarum]|uniref:Uncharacterized protein n=1 Tax=Choanephora cucurbitarum TaxID=101091 RepID=A0A1C7NHR4_9FUNG|nr:hypothetical protein A0J61_03304 [Choanephora cucurbitarum]